MSEGRRLKLGAHLAGDGVLFAAFAEAASCAVLLLDAQGETVRTLDMEPCGGGYFRVFAPGVSSGACYWFRLDGRRLPDPYARSLPQGVHGPGRVVGTNFVFEHPPPRRSLASKSSISSTWVPLPRRVSPRRVVACLPWWSSA